MRPRRYRTARGRVTALLYLLITDGEPIRGASAAAALAKRNLAVGAEPLIVIGLFPNADLAGQCLTNLEEADFGPHDLSVVMKTRQEVKDLADVSGVLNQASPEGLARALERAGLSPSEARDYRDAVRSGDVFIAVRAGDASDAAREMLADARARMIRVLGTNAMTGGSA